MCMLSRLLLCMDGPEFSNFGNQLFQNVLSARCANPQLKIWKSTFPKCVEREVRQSTAQNLEINFSKVC